MAIKIKSQQCFICFFSFNSGESIANLGVSIFGFKIDFSIIPEFFAY
jgi:hypothetical protein